MRCRLRTTAAVLAFTFTLANGAGRGGAMANAAGADETPTPPATAPAAPPAREVQLIAEEPNLTYWIYGNPSLQGGNDETKKIGFTGTSFRNLCTVPCSAPLGPGTYSLGVSRGGGALVTVPPLTLRGDEVLKATYNSRWAMRLAFLLGGLVTASIGAAVAFSGDPSEGRQAIGVAVLAVGVLGMATPIFLQDRARIEIIKP